MQEENSNRLLIRAKNVCCAESVFRQKASPEKAVGRTDHFFVTCDNIRFLESFLSVTVRGREATGHFASGQPRAWNAEGELTAQRGTPTTEVERQSHAKPRKGAKDRKDNRESGKRITSHERHKDSRKRRLFGVEICARLGHARFRASFARSPDKTEGIGRGACRGRGGHRAGASCYRVDFGVL